MYGMINQAMADLIVERHGEASWHDIVRHAGVAHARFLELDSYDDAITYALVSSAGDVLDVPVDDLLFELGRYWLLYTGSHMWSYLFDLAGNDFLSFLDGLDDLHDRVQTMMPDSRMPQFTVVAATDHFVLEYRSDRVGLAPMVEGMLVGLQDHFGERWGVERMSRAASDELDRFVLRRLRSVPADRAA